MPYTWILPKGDSKVLNHYAKFDKGIKLTLNIKVPYNLKGRIAMEIKIGEYIGTGLLLADITIFITHLYFKYIARDSATATNLMDVASYFAIGVVVLGGTAICIIFIHRSVDLWETDNFILVSAVILIGIYNFTDTIIKTLSLLPKMWQELISLASRQDVIIILTITTVIEILLHWAYHKLVRPKIVTARHGARYHR